VKSRLQVFISYAGEDLEIATRLYDDLKKAGLDPWMDKKDIRPGQNWEVTLKRAIKESKYFIALLSSTSVSKRSTVRKEYNYALTILEEVPPDDIFIIPVRIDDCDVSNEKLGTIHWANLFPSYEVGFKEILRSFHFDGEDALSPPEQDRQHLTNGDELVWDSRNAEKTYPRCSAKESKPISNLSMLKKESVSQTIFAQRVLRSRPQLLSDYNVKVMLKKFNFPDRRWNPSGKFRNDFIDNEDGTVTDRITRLMWEKMGSSATMPYDKAITQNSCILFNFS
jgi:hypothetical protein